MGVVNLLRYNDILSARSAAETIWVMITVSSIKLRYLDNLSGFISHIVILGIPAFKVTKTVCTGGAHSIFKSDFIRPTNVQLKEVYLKICGMVIKSKIISIPNHS